MSSAAEYKRLISEIGEGRVAELRKLVERVGGWENFEKLGVVLEMASMFTVAK
jgi:hypothetical protein